MTSPCQVSFLAADQELKCKRCGSWHVVFGSRDSEEGTPYARTMLYVTCRGEMYYAGTTRTPVPEGKVRIPTAPA